MTYRTTRENPAGPLVIGLVAIIGVHAQPPPTTPQFEAASVRRLTQQTGAGSHVSNPGRISYSGAVLHPIVGEAYGAPVFGPDWLDSERYDINATFPVSTPKEQVALMLRNLLIERFHLVAHNEIREFPAYELAVAKNGPKLKEWRESPTTPALPALRPEEVAGLRRDSDGFPQMPSGHSGIVVGFTGAGRVHIVAVQQTIAQLLDRGRLLPDPITDRTNLTGKYDFTLDFERGTGVDASGPDLFAAIQQQLGLRLEEKKVPVDVVVIDHIEKVPAEN